MGKCIADAGRLASHEGEPGTLREMSESLVGARKVQTGLELCRSQRVRELRK